MATQFVTVSIDIMHDKNLSPNQKFILAEINQLCSLDSGCFASNRHFSELIGITTMGVSKSLHELENMGYIVIDNSQTKRNFGRTITINSGKSPINSGKSPMNSGKSPINSGLESKGNKTNNKTNNKTVTELPNCINPTIWAEWVQHRKEIKKTLTPSTIKKQIDQLVKFDKLGMDTTEIINASISAGYVGLFAVRKGKSYEPLKSKVATTMSAYEAMCVERAGKQNAIEGELV